MGDIHAGCGLNLEVKEILNKRLVKNIISNDELVNGFCDPNCIDEYIDELNKNNTCYLMKCNGEMAGIAVILHFTGDIIYSDLHLVDIGFYKKFRGAAAVSLSRLALKKFFDENECKQLLAIIEKGNKAALLNAKWLGFELCSENNSSYYLRYRKNGRKHGRLQKG